MTHIQCMSMELFHGIILQGVVLPSVLEVYMYVKIELFEL